MIKYVLVKDLKVGDVVIKTNGVKTKITRITNGLAVNSKLLEWRGGEWANVSNHIPVAVVCEKEVTA